MHPALGRAGDLPDAKPMPNIRNVVTRTMLRDRLRAAGINVSHDATRMEMEAMCESRGIDIDALPPVAPAPQPVYQRAPSPPPSQHVDVAGMSAAQLKAYCRALDPEFKPGLKAQRQVYLAWLYGKGIITEGQAFRGE